MTCFCNASFDVRSCCHIHIKSWKNCPQRAPTAYFQMMNEYTTYNLIETYGLEKLNKKLMKEYKLTNKDWMNILEWYKEDMDDLEDICIDSHQEK